MNHISGFTLIEVIATLILVGIVGVFASFGVVNLTNGYIQSVSNNASSSKAAVALNRIYRELSTLDAISTAQQDSILFSREADDVEIALVGSAIRMRAGAVPTVTTGPILIDNVDSFSLAYFQDDGSVWDDTQNINQLARITVEFILSNNGTPVTFRMTVNPIYNNTYNGPYWK